MGPVGVTVAFDFTEVLIARTDIAPSRARESGLTSLFGTRRGGSCNSCQLGHQKMFPLPVMHAQGFAAEFASS